MRRLRRKGYAQVLVVASQLDPSVGLTAYSNYIQESSTNGEDTKIEGKSIRKKHKVGVAFQQELPLREKRRIEDAIQTGIRAVLGNAGGNREQGECLVYALAGAWVICACTGRPTGIAFGSMYIRTGPNGNVFALEYDAGESLIGTKRFGASYHAFTVISDPDCVELVDFSARHYGEFLETCVKKLGGKKWEWSRPMPTMIWARAGQLPDWLHLSAEEDETFRIMETLSQSEEWTLAISVAERALVKLGVQQTVSTALDLSGLSEIPMELPWVVIESEIG